jgi:sugar transferase (PEP-CTERM system associated)
VDDYFCHGVALVSGRWAERGGAINRDNKKSAARPGIAWHVPGTGWLLFVTDALVICAAFALAITLRYDLGYLTAPSSYPQLGVCTGVFLACQAVGLLSMGLYRSRQRPTVRDKVLRIVFAVFGSTILNLILVWLWPQLGPSPDTLAVAAPLTALAIVGLRTVMMQFIDLNPIKRRVLVVGSGNLAHKIRRLRRRADRRRFEVLGFVALSDHDRREAARLDIAPVLSPDEARRLLPRLDEVVVALDDRRGAMPLDLLLDAKQIGVRIADIVQFLERETERLDLDLLRPGWLLYQRSSQTNALYRCLKRGFDVAFSVVLLTLTSPFLLVAALAILVEDGFDKPLMYRQARVGRHGQAFQLLKFRSMRVDAERDGPQWAKKDGDDRVTRVGRIIRRFRLDELPQLWNILRGDMSVVGPRPERPEFVASLAGVLPLYSYRHAVRPGLAGWAQLNFPYGSSVEDARMKLSYDLWYIKNTTIIDDLMILLQTCEVVIWGRGTSMAGSSDGNRGGSDSPPQVGNQSDAPASSLPGGSVTSPRKPDAA